jgi:hypothetical protein
MILHSPRDRFGDNLHPCKATAMPSMCGRVRRFIHTAYVSRGFEWLRGVRNNLQLCRTVSRFSISTNPQLRMCQRSQEGPLGSLSPRRPPSPQQSGDVQGGDLRREYRQVMRRLHISTTSDRMVESTSPVPRLHFSVSKISPRLGRTPGHWRGLQGNRIGAVTQTFSCRKNRSRSPSSG